MRADFYGLSFETPHVTFYLWSPWRASALEHRMFEAVRALGGQVETHADEASVRIADPRSWRGAIQAVARVLKGWQEEAVPGGEKRSWRWLLEADTDAYGYDHAGEPASLWGLIRVSLERGGPGEQEKSEDIDLEGFGLRIWGNPQQS